MTRQLRTVIADDEPLALHLLSTSLDASGGADIVSCCRNGREVLKAVREMEPELLVLDVEMPGMTGFDVVRALQADTLPLVIFVTAFTQYAVDAFEVNAVDYVLKPIDDQRLAKAMQCAQDRFALLQEGQPREDKGRVVDAIVHIEAEDTVAEWRPNQRIALRDGSQTELLDYNDIVWIDAAGDYMCLHDIHDRTHVIRSTMGKLLKRLNDPRFLRVHRSTAINLEGIQRARSLDKGEYRLTMRGGGVVKVSRSYRAAIHRYLAALSIQ